jgi:anti-sigma factor RsiW
MTICQDMEELMSLTLDGLTTAAQDQAFTTHLATCPRCATTWEAMQQASALLWSSPMLDAPAGFVDSVMLGLERRQQTRRRWVRGLFLGGIALISLAGVAGAAMLLWFGSALPPVVALRGSLDILLDQIVRLAVTAGAGAQVLFRLLGPSAVVLLLGGVSFVAASSIGLWAWALARIDRRSGAGSRAPSAA